MRVVVIGQGLAGAAAAVAARTAGAEVIAIGRTPGASAMWSGVAELFGPIYDGVIHQDLLGARRLASIGRPPQEDRQSRFDRLLRRRSFHPYARLSLAVDDVWRLAREAAEPLALGVHWPAGAEYVANLHGTVRLADGLDAAIWPGRLDARQPVRVVGFEHFPAVAPEPIAAAIQAHGLHADAAWVALPNAPGLAQSPAQAAAQLESLDAAALAELGGTLAAGAGDRLLLLPPVLGRTLESHARIRQALEAGTAGIRLAELASVHHSLHGLRLHHRLERALRAAGATLRHEPVDGVVRHNGRIQALQLAGEQLGLDALVLATGRAVGGGLARSRPLIESLLGLPLYLEGSPVTPHQHPPELATRRLFDDHPLFQLGIGVSPELEPLDTDGRPACENVRAAGLVVGGTNFARDGSAFGVSLVTGRLAGLLATGAEA